MNGQLSEHPLAELIREIVSAKLSGALRLRRGRVKAVVYALRGEVVYARSNLRAHRLIACAPRSGVSAVEKLAGALTEMMDDAEAAGALAAAGASEREMADLRSFQSTDVMRPFLVWVDGEWAFDARARPAEEQRATINLDGLLLEGARRLPPDFAAARLADDEEMISPANAPPPDLQLLPVEGFVLSRVEGPVRLADLVAVSGLPEGQTRQAAYALALCRLLARDRWPEALTGEAAQGHAAQSPANFDDEYDAARAKPKSAAKSKGAAEPETAAAGAAEEPDPRAEMRELLARVYDADYFQILGVPRAAAAAEIKRAYYALARRFHPDRFRQVVGDSERAEIETAFALVTKAYETLQDADDRATYENRLPPESARKSSPPRSPVAFSTERVAAAKDVAKVLADPAAAPQYRAEESFQQGLAATERGDEDGARAYFGEAVRLAPQQARYHAFYGRTLMREAATRRQAESELQAAAKLDPENASYHVALAELYRSLSLQRRAEGELNRALVLDPDNAAARRMLAQMKGQG